MGQPLVIREGLCFANSLIEGTAHEEVVIAWKTKLKLSGRGVSTLGSKYWRNFKRRHDNILDSGSSKTQALLRKEWSTHLNFTKMYKLVYDCMKEARVLEDLDKPFWMNFKGDIFVSAEETLGMKGHTPSEAS